jgi:PQ loop repeat
LQAYSGLRRWGCNGHVSLQCASRSNMQLRGRRLTLSRLVLFLIFFPRATPSGTDPATDPEPPSFRTALLVAGACLLHAVVLVILSFYFVYAAPTHLQGWANFLGIFSTVLSSIQYFPQIYTTYQLKRVGSLSIPMMCIQTPGSFVWAASLATRLGPSGWSAWGVYCVTGCLQGTLLVMGSYFEIMNKRREKGDLQDHMIHGNGDAHPPSEQTPLLRSDSG